MNAVRLRKALGDRSKEYAKHCMIAVRLRKALYDRSKVTKKLYDRSKEGCGQRSWTRERYRRA